MKGVLAEWIRSMTGGPIQSDSDIVYTDPPSLTDLEDNGLVTKDMLLSSIPGVPVNPVITLIVGGTTSNPITVSYGDMTNPTLLFRNSDGSNYAGAANNTDNAYAGSPSNSITLTGDDNGSGKFVDSFTFIIKP